jgi:hypothetical protein
LSIAGLFTSQEHDAGREEKSPNANQGRARIKVRAQTLVPFVSPVNFIWCAATSTKPLTSTFYAE